MDEVDNGLNYADTKDIVDVSHVIRWHAPHSHIYSKRHITFGSMRSHLTNLPCRRFVSRDSREIYILIWMQSVNHDTCKLPQSTFSIIFQRRVSKYHNPFHHCLWILVQSSIRKMISIKEKTQTFMLHLNEQFFSGQQTSCIAPAEDSTGSKL